MATLLDATDQPALPVVAPEVDANEAMLEFSACMREQGVEFPDPVPDENGQLRFDFRPRSAEELESLDLDALLDAGLACREHLEGVEIFRPDDAEFDEELFLAFAECMRAEGIENFPDPGPNGRPNLLAMARLDFTSDAFQDAAETCGERVGAPGPDDGPPADAGGDGAPAADAGGDDGPAS